MSLFCISVLLLGLHAKASEGSQTVSLGEVLSVLSEKSPKIVLYEQDAELALGSLLQATGAFDYLIHAGVETNFRDQLLDTQTGTTEERYFQLLTKAALKKKLRINADLEISGSYPVTRGPQNGANQTQVQIASTFPLLKMGSRGLPVAAEHAAQKDVDAARFYVLEQKSELITSVVIEYWKWVAAGEELKIAQQMEDLSEALLSDVEALIRAHERPEADRAVFQGNLAKSTANRILKEERFFEQRLALWTAMGLQAPTRGVFYPKDKLPSLPNSSWNSSSILEQAINKAQISRPVLKYLQNRVDASRIRLEAAERNEFHDLDLKLAFIGAKNEVTDGGSAPSQSVPTWSLTGVAVLSYTWPVNNDLAKGATLLASSTLAKNVRELEISKNVAALLLENLTSALSNLELRLRAREDAVQMFKRALQNTVEKFRHGMVTNVDVLNVEEQYVFAMADKISDQLEYATVLARFQHETGTTAEITGMNKAVLDPDLFSSWPFH